MMRKILMVALASILLAVAAIFYKVFVFLETTPGDSNEAVIFEVAPGKTFRAVANELKEKNLITDTFSFRLYAKLTHSDGNVRVGEYSLQSNMRPTQILDTLTSGKSIERPFTVREGDNVFDISADYEKNGFGKQQEFLRLVRDPAFIQQVLGEPVDSLEGYLFPETYYLTKFTTTKVLITKMVDTFKNVYAEVEKANDTGMKRHQIVTLASVIEKETGAPEERPMISSVFHNRLKKNMRLQSDPTIIYGIWVRTGAEPQNIHKSDIMTYSPFNTYTVNGLPKGPIGNPGKEALMATVKPVTSDYLYFVSKNDGTHVFTSTYKDHNAAVKTWQQTRQNREGKSWRDRISKKK